MTEAQDLTLGEIRKILLRHRGSMTEVAASVGKSKMMVTDVLKRRRNSFKIENAARQKAMELLSFEQEQKRGAA